VVEGHSVVTIHQAVDPPFNATVIGTDSRRDIALLGFDPLNVGFNSLNTSRLLSLSPLDLGDIDPSDNAKPLIALGYSGTGIQEDGTVAVASVNVGVLSHLIGFGTNGLGTNLIMDAPIDPGDSGGPVLDGDGMVVGMTRAVREQTPSGQRVVGTFFAVHVDEIRDALPALKRGESR